MGAVIVHNAAGEPVVLRDALVLIWDALDRPRTGEEICDVIAGVTGAVGLADHVAEALDALGAVDVVEEAP
jgi:hypothetical protein